MLCAYYSMPAADFIAQLRTYVIAMGLSPQVVDAVDNLCGADDLQATREMELQEAEEQSAKETKDEIIAFVRAQLKANSDLTAEDVLRLLEDFEI